MRKSAALTELEGCVLGEIALRQPCTAYVIRQEFLHSLTPHWSGSAGAVYPLFRRLEARGYIRATNHATGRRPSKHYALTRAGRTALGRWIGPPLSRESAGVPMDPLRSRMRFLQFVPPARRRKFLASAIRETESWLEELSQVGSERSHAQGHFYGLILRGAMAMMQSRIDWLREIGDAVER
jgi:DNA-binding PadR family transcriptional regulator